MKKIILTLIVALMFPLGAMADELSDVKAAFDAFVNASNSYAQNLPSYYTQNPKIVRVVYKKEGGTQSVIIPFSRYLSELKKGAGVAKATGYKNTYTNRRYAKIGNDYKISTIRIPRNDKSGLPAHFIMTKTQAGWKIKEESLGTNVQKFLNAK